MSKTFNSTLLSTPNPGFNRNINIPYIVMEVIVAITAIIGNFLVIIVFAKQKKLRRHTNYHIISLAIADLILGLVGVPFAILVAIGLPENNKFACLFTLCMLVSLCSISVSCVVGVSIDRFWAILFPMAYFRNARPKITIGIILTCWFVGSFVGFLPLMGWHEDTNFEGCLFLTVMSNNYMIFCSFSINVTPFIILIVCYGMIYRVIVKQMKHSVIIPDKSNSVANTLDNDVKSGRILRLLSSTSSQQNEIKATISLSIIVLFFVICKSPLHTINCIIALNPTRKFNPILIAIAIIMSHFNSSLNPVLYACRLKDFRGSFLKMICRKEPIKGLTSKEPKLDKAPSTEENKEQEEHNIVVL